MLLATLMLAIGLLFALNASNQAKAYTGDGPAIYGLAPTGTINTTSTSVEAYFEGMGVQNTTLTLDGVLLTGCSVTVSWPNGIDPWDWSVEVDHVRCPVTGLAGGIHTINARGEVNSDYGTGTSYDTATFNVSTCTPAKPGLTLNAAVPSWDSYSAYLARDLSVDWTIHNTGSVDASSVTLTSASNNNGVTIIGSPTASYGSIAAGASVTRRLHYNVTNSTGFSWHTVNTGTGSDACGTPYTYPV